MGALSATWNKNYRQPFEPLVPGFRHVPFNNIEALQQAVDGDTAAVILEVVQGEGGVYLAENEYLQAARQICSQQGALLIIDEVQTGFGRTGKMFAIQHSGITPDMLCLAKSIAGGLPMGAVLFGSRVTGLAPGLHGSTFGGNPLACAAALAVLRVMERDQLPQKAAEQGAYPDVLPAPDPIAAGERSARAGADDRRRAKEKGRSIFAGDERPGCAGFAGRDDRDPLTAAIGDHITAGRAGGRSDRRSPVAKRVTGMARTPESSTTGPGFPYPTLLGLVERYSPSGQEKAAVDWLVERMAGLGFGRAFADPAGNAVGVMGDGPRQVILLGHIDTVPGEIPVRVEEDSLYGRGSVDAKGPLAAFVDAVAATGALPGWQFVVIGAVEEEGDSTGARSIVEQYRPDFVIVGEPSHWERITLGYKGSAWTEITVRRAMEHSARQSESACEQAVALWSAIQSWANEL